MAWTAPRTWVTSEVVTASVMNTHVRDNFLETGPAVATVNNSGLIVSTGTNDLAQRIPDSDSITTSETTTSTSYTNLATTGPDVTVTTGTIALGFWSATIANNTADETARMSVAISGATTLSANDNWSLMVSSDPGSTFIRAGVPMTFTGLTAGSNTFTCVYRVSGGTGTFLHRRLSIVPI